MHPDEALGCCAAMSFISAVCSDRGRVELHCRVLVSSELMLCCHHGGPMPRS